MNDLLLEDTYALVQVKQFLLSEGYTSEQIEFLLEKGLWDKIKRGVAIGTAAAGMMGGSMAHGSELSDAVRDFRDSGPRIAQGIGDEAFAKASKDQRALESLIDQSAQKAFTGGISDGGLRALKAVISNLDFRDPDKARKAVQIIAQTAQKLNADGQSETRVYSTANQISSSLSR
jgi:hypothetical protein